MYFSKGAMRSQSYMHEAFLSTMATVYGSLTATLVTLYFGVIVVLQRLFVLLTVQQYTLAVVASTLLIAALFTP